jgi:dTDP-4-amino-4,6-dideoxygalactose transaminase
MSPCSRLYLSPPHMSGRELELVQAAFASNWIAPAGPDIDAFEREMCAYTGAAHAVALSSGTAAIHLALLLAGVGQGDEVLCSTFTFAGSAFPIRYCGATPVFVDSDRDSWNMDPALLEQAIRERIRACGKPPKACIVVHLYGSPADLNPIAALCRSHGIALIEDAAESLGGRYRERHTGTIGQFGVLSFNGNKIITTSGGGMLLGLDKAHIDRARFLATQARDPTPHYQHSVTGFNYRMSNIAAAIGRGQLEVIEQRVARRREIFEWYRCRLEPIEGIRLMPEPRWARGNRWLTCITVDAAVCGADHEAIRLALEADNIESRPLWKPMHLQPVFADCPAVLSGVSEDLFAHGLCLPSGSAMTEDDLERVSGLIQKCTEQPSQ